MPDIQLHIAGQQSMSAELDMESGILRLSYQDRDHLLRVPEDAVIAEVEGLSLEQAVIINPLTQRIMLTENALTQAQALLAG